MKKDFEISSLGLRDEDLRNAGFSVAEDFAERRKQLVELNLRSLVAEVASVECQVKAAEQRLLSSQKLLEELVIRSPVEGIVGTKYFEKGEYLKENEKLLTVIDTSSVYAVFYIQEQEMVNLVMGSKLDIYIPSLNQNYNSLIDEISPVADSQSGNFLVKSRLQNMRGELKPGMFVKCSIQKSERQTLPVLPESVLLSETAEETAKIFCIVNDRLVSKTIDFAARKDGKLWIKDGLLEGEIVVDKPSPFLKEGQLVKTL